MTQDPNDPMFSSRTDHELAAAHSKLVERARAAGVQVEDHEGEWERQALIDACQKLHDQLGEQTAVQFDAPTSSEHSLKLSDVNPKVAARVKAARANGEPLPEGSGPGLRRLRQSPHADATRQQVQADQEMARADASAKRKRREAAAQQEKTMTDATQATASAPKARKAAAKGKGKAASAKKAATAKPAKAAKKTAAAKPAKKAAGAVPRGAKIADTATIKLKDASTNPRREGTTQYDRFEALRKAHGKTVGEFMKKGGDRNALNLAISRGEATAK